MAVGIIHSLEPVDVDQQEGELLLEPGEPFGLFAQGSLEVPAVPHLGQGIGQRQPLRCGQPSSSPLKLVSGSSQLGRHDLNALRHLVHLRAGGGVDRRLDPSVAAGHGRHVLRQPPQRTRQQPGQDVGQARQSGDGKNEQAHPGPVKPRRNALGSNRGGQGEARNAWRRATQAYHPHVADGHGLSRRGGASRGSACGVACHHEGRPHLQRRGKFRPPQPPAQDAGAGGSRHDDASLRRHEPKHPASDRPWIPRHRPRHVDGGPSGPPAAHHQEIVQSGGPSEAIEISEACRAEGTNGDRRGQGATHRDPLLPEAVGRRHRCHLQPCIRVPDGLGPGQMVGQERSDQERDRHDPQEEQGQAGTKGHGLVMVAPRPGPSRNPPARPASPAILAGTHGQGPYGGPDACPAARRAAGSRDRLAVFGCQPHPSLALTAGPVRPGERGGVARALAERAAPPDHAASSAGGRPGWRANCVEWNGAPAKRDATARYGHGTRTEVVEGLRATKRGVVAGHPATKRGNGNATGRVGSDQRSHHERGGRGRAAGA